VSITTRVSFVGFLLAVSALNVSTANATTEQPRLNQTVSPIESRLSRITDAMKQREIEPSEASEGPAGEQVAYGWVNGRRGGWGNGRRGGFINRRWGDGGRFYNYRGGGGGFINRY
jgi:rSAM-associated Gly-rich repeat protein